MVTRFFAGLGLMLAVLAATPALAETPIRARQMSAEQRWIPDARLLRPGDWGVREVTVTALGVETPQMPDHFLTASIGVHQELAEASFSAAPDGEGGMVVTAVFRFAVRVDAPAEIDVKPIYFPWENIETGERRVAAAAPRQLAPDPRSREEALADARAGRGAHADAIDWADARRTPLMAAVAMLLAMAAALGCVVVWRRRMCAPPPL